MPVLSDPSNVSGCLSECVSEWKTSGRTSQMVDLALSSMALAVFSRTQNHRGAALKASVNYLRLLKLSQCWISRVGRTKLDVTDIDACLLAIALMGRFEGVTYSVEDSDNSLQSTARMRGWHHHDGAIAVLKAWYDGRNRGESSTSSIIKNSRRGILRFCLLRNQPLPEWLHDGETFGEHGNELESDNIEVQILSLRQEYMKLEQGIDATPAEHLNDAVQKIDKALQDLASQLPRSCFYQQHILTGCGSFPQRHIFSPIVYSYQQPGHADIWMQYFSTRMLINKLRIRILNMSYCGHTHEQQRTHCHAVIESMGESLASTIPFCLERFSIDKDKPDTILLNPNADITPFLINSVIWPLSIASGVEGVNFRQRSWFRGELAVLGRLIGDRVIESVGVSGWNII